MKASICLCDRNRADGAHRGMLITRAGRPLWGGRDKGDPGRPVTRRRGPVGVCSRGSPAPPSYFMWENKSRPLRPGRRWLGCGAGPGERKPIESLRLILSAAGEMRYWQGPGTLSRPSRLIRLGGRPRANWICPRPDQQWQGPQPEPPPRGWGLLLCFHASPERKERCHPLQGEGTS